MSYTQLTQEQRYQIYALLKIGHNQKEIAEVIGSHKSTISRELRRNCGQKGYRPKQAHSLAIRRRYHRQVRIQSETWQIIEDKLQLDWSPEQISGCLCTHQAIKVSHEWIYQYVLMDKRMGGHLHEHLRCKKKRSRRFGGKDRRGQLPHRVSIEQRPEIVAQRQRIGDWEVDTMVGHGHHQAIVTLTERKSRFALLRKVEQRTSDLVCNAMIELLQPIVDRVHTITADNG
jgi:IS30 family transposase